MLIPSNDPRSILNVPLIPQEKLNLERGVTFSPSIDENSRKLAVNAVSRYDDENVFEKLHKEAFKRHLKWEVSVYSSFSCSNMTSKTCAHHL